MGAKMNPPSLERISQRFKTSARTSSVVPDGKTWEVWLSPYDRIDYFGYKNGIPTYVEVKNWFVKIKEVKKIVRYGKLIEQNHPNLGKLYVICGGIHNDGREKRLMEMNCFVNIILTKDIKELK